MPVNVTLHNGQLLPDGDAVQFSGTIEGILDPEGQPKLFHAHAWKSHLESLPTRAARVAYCAALIKQAAIQAGDIPGPSIDLAATVAV
jgi:hypothetical protein